MICTPLKYTPTGTRFWSQTRQQEMLLASEGSWAGWVFYLHPDGQWVSLRKATTQDLADLEKAKQPLNDPEIFTESPEDLLRLETECAEALDNMLTISDGESFLVTYKRLQKANRHANDNGNALGAVLSKAIHRLLEQKRAETLP